jgi:hypothetical protein
VGGVGELREKLVVHFFFFLFFFEKGISEGFEACRWGHIGDMLVEEELSEAHEVQQVLACLDHTYDPM